MRTSEIVRRRFGSAHEQPCNDPSMITCAKWECQIKGECRLPKPVSPPKPSKE